MNHLPDHQTIPAKAGEMLPLLPEASMDAIVAWHGGRPVRRDEFIRQVNGVAARLPETTHALNLCKDRYWFCIGLFASMARGISSLMPNAVAPDLLAALHEEFPALVCLCDQAGAGHGLPEVVISGMAAAAESRVPLVPAGREVLYVHTSGSTGKPVRHGKTFARLRQCAEAGAKHIRAMIDAPCAIIGTVPFQHMYGLESTIFLPLFGAGSLTSGLPFFPADVAAALVEVPAPRLLVTTPFHLRKLIESDIVFPSVAAIISATAPLSAELAGQAEARLAAPVMEIYGSTETGQLATRQTARETSWRIYDGVQLALLPDGPVASGGHLEGPQRLNDIIEFDDDGRFRLLGRNSDIVNVAGKRNSLANLNHLLNSLPGVVDGVFCAAQSGSKQEVERLAAFVVASGVTPRDLLAALAQKIDPIFLPRPIVFVDALPRERNGKLTAAALKELMARHLS